ncbi:MAG: peptidylprolyl isomerase [Bacteroidetes bacterium]|nr:peptidylprolyl isomerase [Bacteroidota bacterium]MBK9519587.1 peptidylprolyl isomerase [Anaeromyxobacter sp.]MBL0274902.1 peptidylprolyl isomerase [Anaeromyxobacter sp.]
MAWRDSRWWVVGPAALALVVGPGCAAGRGAGEASTASPAATRAPATTPAPPRSMAELLASSPPSDWRRLAPEDTLQLELPSGRVVIALAPAFAPAHAANLRALARERYFDGLAVVRAQDNFVVQWGDPAAGEAGAERPITTGRRTLPPEFTRAAAGLPFTPLPDGDVFAPEVGFSDGLPVARDPAAGRAWLAHCYGMVGAGRDDAPASGGGAELYVVIGHAPRQLDRNATVVGRVVQGMELLSALPRGPAPMGFYLDPARRTPLRSVRLAADLPPAERSALEVLDSGSATFAALVEARRNRRDPWYLTPAGRIDLCSVPLPVRPAAP